MKLIDHLVSRSPARAVRRARRLAAGGQSVRAARLLSAAAAAGLVEAQHEVAHAYLAGTLFPRNPAEAARWFLAAAEAGHVPSMCRL
ncbi:MAG TPA: SEL1-like repeat protein, partial [Acidiphilium sp.]|nr:SEL1-like repeat protein [Acidiphilium sp.]